MNNRRRRRQVLQRLYHLTERLRRHLHRPRTDVNERQWDARIRASLAQVVDEGRWRAPREFDAFGPSGILEGGPVV